ncbi:MAG: hypothetical protein M1409_11155, partial [Actinobacteria bacterium]|nr:hypothetical protein [Actinomycetota bacterium]
MNKKDRFFAAVNLNCVDRIPTIYRAANYITQKLMNYFGINNKCDISNNYKVLLEKLGADFWASGSQMGNFTTFVPEYIGQSPKYPFAADNSLYYTIGIKTKIGKIKNYDFEYYVFDEENAPWANAYTISDIDKKFLISKLDNFNFKNIINKKSALDKNNYKNIKNDNESIICIGDLSSFFMMCAYLRGFNNFLMDLVSNKKLAGFIINIVGEFVIEFNRRFLKEFGSKAEYFGTWDDVAGQNGLIFSPELFKKFFVSLYKKLIDMTKEFNLVFSWHCCGSVHEVLPLMIDCGIDIFNVVQTSAKNMQLEILHRLYSKIIS